MAQTKKKIVKRRFIRFDPDPGTLAVLTPQGAGGKPSAPMTGLVINEAQGGCSVVTVRNRLLQEGATLTVQLGHFEPTEAEIRWVKVFDGAVTYVGLRYLKV